MARNRGAIKTLIRSHTGLTKETLENAACDTALKIGLLKHPFTAAMSTPDDVGLTEDEYRVSISDASAFGIVTARIVEEAGSRNTELILKNRTWWDKHVINPEDNMKGWPRYAIHVGDYVYFDRPLLSGLELRLRIITEQTFTDDDTDCPIGILDIFVEKYATYEVFLDIGNHARAAAFKIQALGPRYDDGKVGGALKDAIDFDWKEIVEEYKMDGRTGAESANGMAVLNNLGSWHDRNGLVDLWY